MRTGGVEPPQPEATGLQPAELADAQRPREKRQRGERRYATPDLLRPWPTRAAATRASCTIAADGIFTFPGIATVTNETMLPTRTSTKPWLIDEPSPNRIVVSSARASSPASTATFVVFANATSSALTFLPL